MRWRFAHTRRWRLCWVGAAVVLVVRVQVLGQVLVHRSGAGGAGGVAIVWCAHRRVVCARRTSTHETKQQTRNPCRPPHARNDTRAQPTETNAETTCVCMHASILVYRDAVNAVRGADLVLLFLGSSSKGSFNGTTYLDTVEKEGMDRTGAELAAGPAQHHHC